MTKKFFLTVDWCGKGSRGIFCSKGGSPFTKDTEHTYNDMWDILDCFYVVLSPQSIEFTEEELKEYHRWHPLAEYSNQFGIARKD